MNKIGTCLKVILFIFLLNRPVIANAAEEAGIETSPNIASSIADNDEAEISPLKAGDHILVKIYPEDQYIKGGEFEVSIEGNVTLPLIGKVEVSGLSLPQAEAAIQKILAADYFVNPEVSIQRKASEKTMLGPSFLVLGAVKQPGTYHMPGDGKKFKMLAAISMAGGFSEVANIKKIKIVRDKNGVKSSIRINAQDIIEGNESDIEIKGGDIIHVSESLF